MRRSGFSRRRCTGSVEKHKNALCICSCLMLVGGAKGHLEKRRSGYARRRGTAPLKKKTEEHIVHMPSCSVAWGATLRYDDQSMFVDAALDQFFPFKKRIAHMQLPLDFGTGNASRRCTGSFGKEQLPHASRRCTVPFRKTTIRARSSTRLCAIPKKGKKTHCSHASKRRGWGRHFEVRRPEHVRRRCTGPVEKEKTHCSHAVASRLRNRAC